MSATKLKNAHDHTKIHLVFVNMSNENNAIAAGACVILCLKNLKPKKRRFRIRPSLIEKNIYSGTDMMVDCINVLTERPFL